MWAINFFQPSKKEIKRMKKVNMIADGYVLGEMKSKMMGMDED